jgi:hypothetical protein
VSGRPDGTGAAAALPLPHTRVLIHSLLLQMQTHPTSRTTQVLMSLVEHRGYPSVVSEVSPVWWTKPTFSQRQYLSRKYLLRMRTLESLLYTPPSGDGTGPSSGATLRVLDQLLLPRGKAYLDVRGVEDAWKVRLPTGRFVLLIGKARRRLWQPLTGHQRHECSRCASYRDRWRAWARC